MALQSPVAATDLKNRKTAESTVKLKRNELALSDSLQVTKYLGLSMTSIMVTQILHLFLNFIYALDREMVKSG